MKNNMKAILSLACAATLAAGVGVFTMNNASETVNADTAHTEAIFMANGASIRYSDPSGIRFIGYVSEDVYTEQSEVGMTISVGGVKEVFSTETIEGAAWQWTASDVAGYKKFQVAITRIPDTQYATEMTAQAFVDDEVSEEIVTRSIATVASAALAANSLENNLETEQVTALEGYVADAAVALPFDATEVSVQSGVLTFDAVENAKGYLVQFGGEVKNIPATDAETYSVDLGEFDGTIKMMPYGNGIAYTYAAKPCVVFTNPAMLADFNDASYESNIGVITGEQHSEFKEAPAFEKEGTPAGTVTFGVKIDDYRGGTSNWSRLAAFTVTLPNALNLENEYNGVMVRLHLNHMSNFADQIQTATLELLDDSKQTKWNDNKSTVATTIGDGIVSPTGWMELFITKAQFTEMGYATGDTVLTFGIRGISNTNADTGCEVNVSMDYIKYATYAEVMAGALAENELANFNDAAYTSIVNFIPGSTYSKFYTAPSYADGVVSFGLYWDEYTYASGVNSRIVPFNVTLPKAIDLNKGYDGIKIKAYVGSNNHSNLSVQLEMFAKGQNTSWNGYANKVLSADSVTTGWIEFVVTNAQLTALGYATGDTVLTIGYRMSGAAYDKGYYVNGKIDYIEYYKEPTEQLLPGQIASFNKQSYASMISTLLDGEYGSVGDSRVKKVTYLDETACAGSNGGALDIVMVYTSGVWRVDFKVDFAKAIDTTGYDGIEIRFKLYDTSLWNLTEENSLFLKMINSSGSMYVNKADERFVQDISVVGEWVTVRFTAENVNKSLTNDGKTMAFQIGVKGPFDYAASVNGSGACGIYLDDISYYKDGL